MRLLIAVLLLVSAQVYANSDEAAIESILVDIKHGWEQADGQPFRDHFLDVPGSRYFESGGQNLGLDDLINHHVIPEGKSIKLELNFSNLQVNIEDDFAWVLADTEVMGSFVNSERTIHNRGHQTILLRKVEGKWKVLHTHSSGRPVKPKP